MEFPIFHLEKVNQIQEFLIKIISIGKKWALHSNIMNLANLFYTPMFKHEPPINPELIFRQIIFEKKVHIFEKATKFCEISTIDFTVTT